MYSARRRPQAAILIFRRGVGRSFPVGKSWRTRRIARRKRNVSDLPYTAPPLSCAAFFVNERNKDKEPDSGKGNAAGIILFLE